VTAVAVETMHPVQTGAVAVPVLVKPVAQVRAAVEVHVAALRVEVHATQAPAVLGAYPALHVMQIVVLVQAAQLAVEQVTHVPGATIKNPEVQDEQAVTLGVDQIEQYWQHGTNGQVAVVVPVVPAVP